MASLATSFSFMYVRVTIMIIYYINTFVLVGKQYN